MTSAWPQTSRKAVPAKRFLANLAGKMRQLGLSVSFWDAASGGLTGQNYQGQFCRRMCQEKRFCLEWTRRVARDSCRQGKSLISTSPSGCCMLAAPTRHRHRLVGAVVACFPMIETPDSEGFVRACSRAHLDREAMAALCRQEALHASRQAQGLGNVLEWAIGFEQATEVAREELETLSTNLANTYEELALLYSISGSMKVTHGTTEFFENLCQELLEVMEVEAAAVVLHPREHSGSASGTGQVVCAGKLSLTTEQLLEISRKHLAGWFSSDSPSRAVIDNQFAEHFAGRGAHVEQIHTLVAAPLMTAGNYQGALVGINKIDGEFDSADLKLMGSISSQAAVFLENRHLYEDLQNLLMGVLHALTASIDAKDPYTCGHSHRVALVSRKLAEMSGFDEYRAGRIYLAGLLHDIGKIGIPELVLQKAGKLTDAEYDCVKRHPEIGATILNGIKQMEDIIPAILSHHERLDGKGYPRGLSGKDIPIEALIMGLADSFDAMTSCRTYRDAMPIEAVVAEIRRCSGTQFEPRLAELLLSLDMDAFLAQIGKASTDQIRQPEQMPSRKSWGN